LAGAFVQVAEKLQAQAAAAERRRRAERAERAEREERKEEERRLLQEELRKTEQDKEREREAKMRQAVQVSQHVGRCVLPTSSCCCRLAFHPSPDRLPLHPPTSAGCAQSRG